jgi:hypothetical protein
MRRARGRANLGRISEYGLRAYSENLPDVAQRLSASLRADVYLRALRMQNSGYADRLHENGLTAGLKILSFGHFGIWYPQL